MWAYALQNHDSCFQYVRASMFLCVDLPSFVRASGYISFSRSQRVCVLPSGETGRNSFWMNGLSLKVYKQNITNGIKWRQHAVQKSTMFSNTSVPPVNQLLLYVNKINFHISCINIYIYKNVPHMCISSLLIAESGFMIKKTICTIMKEKKQWKKRVQQMIVCLLKLNTYCIYN